MARKFGDPISRKFCAFFLLVILGTGCASSRMSDHESDNLFKQGRYNEAAARLQKGYDKEGPKGSDALLYLLDVGLAYHSAGRYEESNKAFLLADKLAEIKDYTSITEEAVTSMISENIKDYKGEDFENVLISSYLATNYALMGNREDALVEARRVNQKLYMMVSEGKRKYKQNAYARYLSAILYEADNDYNDAYVDYKNTLKLVPTFPGLGRDLWRCAWVMHQDDDMQQWDQQFNLQAADHEQAKLIGPKSKKGEIIVVYENGISPIKRPNPQFRQVPRFYPRFNPVSFARIDVNGVPAGTTTVLDNIEATAISNLDEKYNGIVAKKLAGVVLKHAISYGVARETNNPMLGFLTEALLDQADQADVRSWNLLPKDLQILRVPVDAGTYHVKAWPIGGVPLPEKVIQVEAGKKVFVNFRFMP